MAARRGKNFSRPEERQVTLSYLHISQDPVVGTNQRGIQLWKRVVDHFNSQMNFVVEDDKRSQKSVEGKWTSIKKDTTKFTGYFNAIRNLEESGTTEEQHIDKALALYKTKHPKGEDYEFLDCWQILRHIPRWAELHQVMKRQTPLADITNGSSDDVFQSPANGGKSCGAAIGGSASDHSSPDDDRDLARPMGSKRAKDAAKRQKLLDQSLISQARAASELTASILEKVKVMKEQAMVAVFALKDENGKLSSEGEEFFALKRARDLAKFKKDIQLEDESCLTSLSASPGLQSVGTEEPRKSFEGRTPDPDVNMETTQQDDWTAHQSESWVEQPVAHRSNQWGGGEGY